MKTRSVPNEPMSRAAAGDGALVRAEARPESHLRDPAVRVVEVDVSGAPTTSGTSTVPCCGTSTAT